MLIIFNGGGEEWLNYKHKYTEIQPFTTNTFCFSGRFPHRFILFPSSRSRATYALFAVPQRQFFSPSYRGSSHTGWREGSLFLLLRRSTNSASRSKHYCSEAEPILVGAPSNSAFRAKHYCSVAPSPFIFSLTESDVTDNQKRRSDRSHCAPRYLMKAVRCSSSSIYQQVTSCSYDRRA